MRVILLFQHHDLHRRVGYGPAVDVNDRHLRFQVLFGRGPRLGFDADQPVGRPQRGGRRYRLHFAVRVTKFQLGEDLLRRVTPGQVGNGRAGRARGVEFQVDPLMDGRSPGRESFFFLAVGVALHNTFFDGTVSE